MTVMASGHGKSLAVAPVDDRHVASLEQSTHTVEAPRRRPRAGDAGRCSIEGSRLNSRLLVLPSVGRPRGRPGTKAEWRRRIVLFLLSFLLVCEIFDAERTLRAWMTEVCEDKRAGKVASPCARKSRTARRRRMEMRSFAAAHGSVGRRGPDAVAGEGESSTSPLAGCDDGVPSYGLVSICGRQRNMEDAVSALPCFFRPSDPDCPPLHLFAVFDGHGGPHVAMMCKERMHRLVAEELGKGEGLEEADWRVLMKRCFARMDEEVMDACSCGGPTPCACAQAGLVTDIVGSTAVVAVLAPEVIVVANCGDSRAVLCRSSRPVPLSTDHKPDHADELARIEASGGRVIYLNGPRVYGILAMSRAIGMCFRATCTCWCCLHRRVPDMASSGDKFLKPIVSSEPEVTVTERSTENECLILASDGLWDVLPNDVVCNVAWNCLLGYAPTASDSISLAIDDQTEIVCTGSNDRSGSRCAMAALLLTKLALARRSIDNISVIVIDLRLKGKSKRCE